jgi:hypothetical protein
MMAERYVPIRSLQAAVKGRETEVLDALRIAWQDGAPHIRCPYAAHTDHHPSWRWDREKGRAYCTCIEQGGHLIVDVVMHLECTEFETAKVRVARILGRGDLIQDQVRHTHQCMDAASLLEPPADQQDPDLAPAYLGHRLGLLPNQVAMPMPRRPTS